MNKKENNVKGKIILPFFHDEFKLVHVGRPVEVVDLSTGAESDFASVAISNSEVLKVREKGWVDEADLREEFARSRQSRSSAQQDHSFGPLRDGLGSL